MIQAKVIADSKSPQGHRLTTLEVVMPRYILAEFNTHRVLSKNSASSRAIPFNKMVKEVQERPFIPYAWQKDHKGMQGNEYFTLQNQIDNREAMWLQARDSAIIQAKNIHGVEVTKQLSNRLLEPFMYHKVLVSGTEWENFFNLRCPDYRMNPKGGVHSYKSWKDLLKDYDFHKETIEDPIMFPLMHNKGQADIHMMFLAEAIYDAMNESNPKELKEGEWHIPYGDNMDLGKVINISKRELLGEDGYNKYINTLKVKVSIARCTRLSYQTLGDNPVIDYEKDLELYEVLSKSGHWSPFEHVARVMTNEEYFTYVNGRIEELSSNNMDNDTMPYDGWCRNFRGFIQQRALMD